MARWDRITSRGNVEDRRSFGPIAVGGLSLTGITILLIANLLTGGDLGNVLGQLTEVAVNNPQPLTRDEFLGEDDYEVFASTVLGSNNEMWEAIFKENDQVYEPPRLVLFREATQSECGVATSQVGPHYCPLDETIYLDETFFDELRTRFGAIGGDVAEAYVISHEVGHHVQNQLGLLRNTQEGDAIAVELQADCFSGLWANSLRDEEVFLPGEIHEALDAAAAVGDDRIQERVTGYVNPESWTHGSSAQRQEWFNRGYESGDVSACSY